MSQHHDPVHPDSDHLTPELVADLDEGLLDSTSAEHAHDHLSQCTQCRELQDALVLTKAGLSDLPPLPMPVDVTDRLLAAIAKERPGKSDGTTVVPISTRRSRTSGWAGRGLGIAASVAGVLLIGALIVPSLMDNSTNDSGSGASSAGDQTVAPEAAQRVNFAASKTGTQYEAAKIDEQVDTLVASSALSSADGSATTGTTPSAPVDGGEIQNKNYQRALAAAVATNPAAAQACLEQYLDAEGVQPLAIDIGTFYDSKQKQTQPAAVIVLPIVGKPVEADVWIVDPDCSGPDARLLYWARIDLPH